ncbi:hypothetical protein ACGFNU_34750 [Spirillospora sp. NPDC048911]|uniref:hypothetical protein n=1 Tax=Spirillospora sp. NPDC048911 TaxID=3364527 RepID=UPI00371FDD67
MTKGWMMTPPENHDPRLVVEDTDAFIEGGKQGEKRPNPREKAQPRPHTTTPGQDSKAHELHVCMGLNSCQGQGRDGSGWMAGTGQCATVFHECHGANECRGQGGCGYTGHDAEQAMPGAQQCRYSGSCASPVNASRVHAAGPFRGTSVWKRARKVFEHRMYEAGVPFGPSPGEGCPDDQVPSYETGRVSAPKKK